MKRRYHIYLSLFLIFLYLLSYDKSYHIPNISINTPINHSNIQSNYDLVCQPIYMDRYAYLQQYKWYIAINLHNNQEILPYLIINLNHLIAFNPNIFISIYESGSTDNTKSMLDDYKKELKSRQIPHEIQMGNESLTFEMNRIDYLVDKRNKAIQYITNQDAILFLNDVMFCLNDLLELEHQRILNQAGLVSGMDYDYKNEYLFHDTWVAMDLNGYHLTSSMFQPMASFTNQIKWIRQVPMQVMSTWNGMVAMDAIPFRNGLKFRRGKNRPFAVKQSGECSTAEPTTLCLDLIKLSYDIMIIPRVKVAYLYSVYKSMKIENSIFNKQYPQLPFHKLENTSINMQILSNTFECMPYYHTGWHPEPYAEYWEKLEDIY
eukprot:NODE_277_length_10928_cov_0.583987.p3 type:complete len:376 gc:universal NODE_277_length_10928_cov_0.583987:2207-1080(-)